MSKSEKRKPRSFTPFLEDAREGDPLAQTLLRIALAHGKNDVQDFERTSTQIKAKMLADLRDKNQVEQELVPLTEEELAIQKRMRYFLPNEKKYKRTK